MLRGCEHIVKGLFFVLLIGLLGACGGPRYRAAESSSRDSDSEKRVRVEAYSFNSRLWRDGKPTTFKLEVYQTDTLLGLSGKGYLGKGALKGRLTADSLEIYFPSSNEYVYEALKDLLSGGDCTVPLADMNILTLFSNLPDSIALDPSLRIKSNYEDSDRPEFFVTQENCPWEIYVEYDLEAPGWRIREFEFTDGKETRLRGRIDRYKSATSVKIGRMRVTPPPGAVRVSP
mgnify:CR=1 FL=1